MTKTLREMLTQKGQHRGPGATDLLVAATGQDTLWLAPPGSND